MGQFSPRVNLASFLPRHRSRRTRRWLACAAVAVAVAGAHAEPSATRTTWRGFEAWRLSDGRTEAVIVPALGGRLLHYALLNGENWMWTGEPGAERAADALMWGGDKTYIGPHTSWNFTQPRMWPPPTAPNEQPHEILDDKSALLSTRSPAWPGYGARVTRRYRFDAATGDLVIMHEIEAVPDSAVIGAVWPVAQVIPTDWVFVPLNAKSPYRDNFFWFSWSKADVGATVLSQTLLRLQPRSGASYKIGAHPPQPALAAVKDGLAFVIRADPQQGQYPEGADGAGFSIEVYHHNLPPPRQYTELEPMSPLRRLDQGATLTTRWNIHVVPKSDSVDLAAAVERLLTAP